MVPDCDREGLGRLLKVLKKEASKRAAAKPKTSGGRGGIGQRGRRPGGIIGLQSNRANSPHRAPASGLFSPDLSAKKPQKGTKDKFDQEVFALVKEIHQLKSQSLTLGTSISKK